jgi:DNA-binding response OmpR family regulator
MSAPLPPHVVVINDDNDLLTVFRELLEGEGYRVSTLSYPTANLSDLMVLVPDLVVLDMVFGGEDVGWNWLQKMRLDRASTVVPVIVCTAAVRLVRDAHEHLTGMGISVVPKPFDIDPFLAEVARLLGPRQA